MFNDVGEWDYLDEGTAPDGRTWDYDTLPVAVRDYQPPPETLHSWGVA